MNVTESTVEDDTLDWLGGLGCEVLSRQAGKIDPNRSGTGEVDLC
jgi:hypothetical protein